MTEITSVIIDNSELSNVKITSIIIAIDPLPNGTNIFIDCKN